MHHLRSISLLVSFTSLLDYFAESCCFIGALQASLMFYYVSRRGSGKREARNIKRRNTSKKFGLLLLREEIAERRVNFLFSFPIRTQKKKCLGQSGAPS